MNIIGISGLAGSGKDTIADILCSKHRYIKVSLADVMKRFAMELWDIPKECLWGPSHLRGTELPVRVPGTGEALTVRKILQHLGTEGGRAIDSDVWVRYTMRIAKTLMTRVSGKYYADNEFFYTPESGLKTNILSGDFTSPKGVVIADCRFLNEISLIRDEGGLLLRVKRPGAGL